MREKEANSSCLPKHGINSRAGERRIIQKSFGKKKKSFSYYSRGFNAICTNRKKIGKATRQGGEKRMD